MDITRINNPCETCEHIAIHHYGRYKHGCSFFLLNKTPLSEVYPKTRSGVHITPDFVQREIVDIHRIRFSFNCYLWEPNFTLRLLGVIHDIIKSFKKGYFNVLKYFRRENG